MIRPLTLALAAFAVVVTTAPASSAAPPRPTAVQAAPLAPADQALVGRAAAYLDGLTTARARFTQTDARGAVSQGELYLKRPGKMRFDYDQPASQLIVSDGGGVILYDRRLKTYERYPLASTPLSLFLARHVSLSDGVVVTRVAHMPNGFAISVRDARRQAQGEVTLTFSDNPLALQEWSILDGQGARTNVRLSNLRPVGAIDPSLFVVRDPRVPEGPR